MTTLHGRADECSTSRAAERKVAVHPQQFDVITADRAVREFQIVEQGPAAAAARRPARGHGGARGLPAPPRARHRAPCSRSASRDTAVTVEPCDGIPRVGGGKLQMVVADRGATNGAPRRSDPLRGGCRLGVDGRAAARRARRRRRQRRAGDPAAPSAGEEQDRLDDVGGLAAAAERVEAVDRVEHLARLSAS
jgi:hypothetical protein